MSRLQLAVAHVVDRLLATFVVVPRLSFTPRWSPWAFAPFPDILLVSHIVVIPVRSPTLTPPQCCTGHRQSQGEGIPSPCSPRARARELRVSLASHLPSLFRFLRPHPLSSSLRHSSRASNRRARQRHRVIQPEATAWPRRVAIDR